MRKLNANDLLMCAKILGKVGKNLKINAEIVTPAEIGIQFFSSALEYADSDLKVLLASVSEMTVEEFEKQPFDYPLEIIDHLAQTEDMKAFLERVKALQNKLSNASVTASPPVMPTNLAK